ncbi:MAG TPA: bifunctional phosphoglucose/phosphomannose isomerase [Candidatus Saccharimonadales bacterium]|nr:bifunctional phosphoglucose/phosphomannose isomerase [Candidatus Saccharimonadales bacterium]
MLDDLQQIHERDQHDALGVAEKQWQQVAYEYDLGGWRPATEIRNIVHSGMGGSALWALLSQSWPGWNVPFEVVRGYDLPAYVGPETLFIASSYSGNTEETLSSLKQAEEKGAQIVIITSRGRLEEIANEKGYLLIKLPTIIPPRYGCFYGFKGLVTLGEELGLLATEGTRNELASTGEFLQTAIGQWLPSVPTTQNRAKQLALEIMGKSPVLYGGPLLAPAAHKWKIGFNENSKNVAWEYAFPEFNHNEFTGWTAQPEHKPYVVVYLLSSFDNDRIKKRFDLSEKLLSGRWPAPERIEAQGETKVQQLLWTVAMGDFVSLYTALLNNVSPIDLGDKDIIERFKKELNS